jgi:hypothetical protein
VRSQERDGMQEDFVRSSGIGRLNTKVERMVQRVRNLIAAENDVFLLLNGARYKSMNSRLRERDAGYEQRRLPSVWSSSRTINVQVLGILVSFSTVTFF